VLSGYLFGEDVDDSKNGYHQVIMSHVALLFGLDRIRQSVATFVPRSMGLRFKIDAKFELGQEPYSA
jgi:hypothetical protein